MLPEPVRRQPGHLLQLARLLEQVGGAGYDLEPAFAVDLGGGEIAPLVRVEDEVAVGARLFRSRWRSQATLRVAAELERQAYEGRDMTRPELEDRGVVFPDLPALAGLTVEPSYSNVRYHPFSISPEDGVSVSLGGGHWWATDVWDRGYDELAGRAAGYLTAPVWGFADHVLTLQATGLVRDGDHAPLRAIGGAAMDGVIATGTTFGSDNPVRGFDRGSRRGNRVWTASAEWRFPIHLRNAPAARELLGFSLTALSGAVFADAGDAWCTPELLSEITGCSDPGVTPLVGAGAELRVDFGALHDEAARLVLGVAQPIRGPAEEPVFYLAIGY